MWSPADLFSHGLDIFLSPVKRTVSYFYEHWVVLALTVLAVAVLIAVVTVLRNRRAGRT